MKHTPQKILIIRLSSLGDILLATPLIRLLRQKYPDAHIDFLTRTEYLDLLKYHPALSELIALDVNRGITILAETRKKIRHASYDLVLDIHNNLRSRYLCWGLSFYSLGKTRVRRVRKNLIIRFLLVKYKINLYRKLYGRVVPVWEKYLRTAHSLNLLPDDGKLDLYLPIQTQETIQKFLNALPENNWSVVIAPGARHFTKRWPEEYFSELIKQIFLRTGQRTILVGGKEDLPVIDKILQHLPAGIATSVAAQFSLLETAAIIKTSRLMISNDSGLMHMGVALEIPLLAIFGSTVEELGFFPGHSRAKVIEIRGLYCRPCSHIGRRSCPEKHFRCMREIKPEDVLSLVLSQLPHI